MKSSKIIFYAKRDDLIKAIRFGGLYSQNSFDLFVCLCGYENILNIKRVNVEYT